MTSPSTAAPPSPFDDPMPLRQLLFGFAGRVPRAVYWRYGVGGPLLVSVMAQLLLGIVGVPPRPVEVLTTLLVAWPCTAVAVKRWHDRDRSGWWVLIWAVPVVGVVWTLIANGCLRGSRGPNRFGADATDRW